MVTKIKEGLSKAILLLEAIPAEDFNYSHIFNKQLVHKSKIPNCGTTGCIGGHFILQHHFDEYISKYQVWEEKLKKWMLSDEPEAPYGLSDFMDEKLSEYTGISSDTKLFKFIFYGKDLDLGSTVVYNCIENSKKEVLRSLKEAWGKINKSNVHLVLCRV